MAGERDIDVDLVAAIFPPATIIAVVIYLMRDLKGDLRHTESLLIGRMDRLGDDYSREMSELKGMLIERIDRLRDDHESLACEMSELKGMPSRD
ncbi:MAG: hypothetical protein OXH52_13190 [Gammaproteobacteria bacterium]|nr:hypothetical protein [Gammaproteobacteria bacterium]